VRVGYAKLGQRIALGAGDDWSSIGSDRDEPTVLRQLAQRNPHHEFVLVGMNTGPPLADLGFPSNIVNPWEEGLRGEVRDGLAVVRRQHMNGAKGLTPTGRNEVIRLYDNLTAHLFKGLDALVIWAGTHGTSNSPMPGIVKSTRGRWTYPQDQYVTYGAYLLRGISVWREPDPLGREEIWLCPDARNILKHHDAKWPRRHPVLGQFNLRYRSVCCRYGDEREPEACGFPDARWHSGRDYWVATDTYVGSTLEICGVHPGSFEGGYAWHDRCRFGMFVNEAGTNVPDYLSRKVALRDWVLPLGYDWLHGNWTTRSLTELGVSIEPAPTADYYPILCSARSTFTTPSSGSGWATAKPWEAFGVRTVCFFHPEYDTQGHIIPTLAQVEAGTVEDVELAHLARWLRVSTPEQLRERVDWVNRDEGVWSWLTQAQYNLFRRTYDARPYLRKIEERISGKAS
jgi:hypothetical protein